MPRAIYTQFFFREHLALRAEEYALTQHRRSTEGVVQRLRTCEMQIEQAINFIRQSALDDDIKATLSAAISQLEIVLAQEQDYNKLIIKYEALATMLQQVVLESNSLEERAAAVDAYLTAFKVPSSQMEKHVKVGLGVTALVLMIGLSIACYFVIPLIPFAALFTLMGIGGWWLGAATFTAGLVTQIGGLVLAMYLINKFNEKIFDPLCRLVQKASDEFRAAEPLADTLRHNFFAAEPVAATESPVNRDSVNDDEAEPAIEMVAQMSGT